MSRTSVGAAGLLYPGGDGGFGHTVGGGFTTRTGVPEPMNTFPAARGDQSTLPFPLRPPHQLLSRWLAEVEVAEEERLMDVSGEGEQVRDQRHPGSGDGCRTFGVLLQVTGGPVLDSNQRSQHAAAQSLTFLEDSQPASLSARNPSKTSRVSGVGERQKVRNESRMV